MSTDLPPCTFASVDAIRDVGARTLQTIELALAPGTGKVRGRAAGAVP